MRWTVASSLGRILRGNPGFLLSTVSAIRGSVYFNSIQFFILFSLLSILFVYGTNKLTRRIYSMQKNVSDLVIMENMFFTLNIHLTASAE